MDESRVDQVSLLGVFFGIGSLALGFMQVRMNRIATGVPYPLWRAASPVLLVTFVLLLLVALLLAARVDARLTAAKALTPYTVALLLGLAGNLILVFPFAAAGLSVTRLMPPDAPYARVGLGPGSWLAALSGYILVLSSLKGLPGRRDARIAIASLAAVLMVALASTGLFDRLSLVQEWMARKDRFFSQLGYHIVLSLSVTAVATVVGAPLGVWAHRRKASERSIFGAVGALQTIPSLALFGLLIAPLAFLSHRFPALAEIGISGVGTAPAFIALTLYALLPIVRNTYIGLKVVDRSIVEAGRGMGMAKGQLFVSVELPLALPVVMSGIRTSLVQAIGNTTVAALIGAGGLGVFIFQGLGQAAPDLILVGTIPIIALAVITDRLMAALIRAITPKGLAPAAIGALGQ